MPENQSEETKKKYHKKGEQDIDPELKAHYQKLDEVVLRYQAGDKSAANEFFELMAPYIDKYVLILTGTAMDLRNSDTLAFYRLFLGKAWIDKNKVAGVRENFKLFSSKMAPEDIRQELCLIFLEKVLPKIQKRENIDFLRPGTMVFRWRVKDWFNKIVRDSLHYATCELNEAQEVPSEEPMPELDTRWILNPVTSKGRSLTPEQRYILYLKYHKGQSVAQIASKLCKRKIDIETLIKKVEDELEDDE